MHQPADMHAVCPHLVYEVEMLFAAATYIGGESEQLRQNAFLESFAIHARALLHFLDPKGRVDDDDDVLAEDFFDSRKAWLAIRGEMPAPLVPVRVRVNKEIAHLTYRRTTLADEVRKWPIPDILPALAGRVRVFAERAPEGALPARNRQQLLDLTDVKPARRPEWAAADAPAMSSSAITDVASKSLLK